VIQKSLWQTRDYSSFATLRKLAHMFPINYKFGH